MSHITPSDSPAQLPDEVLPPVQPPTARFIMQLFVYPLVIVAGIVAVGLLVNWAMRAAAGDPREYVAALKRNNDNRWQAAVTLADTLNNPVNAKYLDDIELARDLVAVLEDELAIGGNEEEDINLRMFLCRALGRFHVDSGVPVLLKAAADRARESELPVRKFALMALADLAEDLPPERLRDDKQAMQVLLQSAQDSEYQIQEAAAFALGVVGGEQATEQLVKLLGPITHPNPRYNAATGLARHGDARAIPVLTEMMYPETDVGIRDEEEKSRDIKLANIIRNSLEATRNLVEKNPQVDRTSLIETVQRLQDADLNALFVERTGFELNDQTRYRLQDEIDATLQVLNQPA